MWVSTRTGGTTWLPVTTALQHLPEKGHIPPILWMIRCHQGVAYAIIASGESTSVCGIRVRAALSRTTTQHVCQLGSHR